MKIGFTYDLRDDYIAEGFTEEETAEFDRADTISSIEDAISAMGHEVERVGNFKNLVKHLSAGKRWDIVFNIAEGMYGQAREAQIPALLDAYRIPYTFSDPTLLTISLKKDLTKLIVRKIGILTPEFLVIKTQSDINKVKMQYPLFAKPLAEGTSKGISADSVIYNEEQLFRVVGSLLEDFSQPVLVEKFLPGREFTVGILGTGDEAKCAGIMEIILNPSAEKDVYSLKNKEKCEELVTYRLADDEPAKKCEQYALQIWREMGFKDAGRMDFRLDDAGEPNFIEVNPLAGLNPVHSDLPIMWGLQGKDFQELIEEIVKNAAKRCCNTP